jgi:hypothetical protein
VDYCLSFVLFHHIVFIYTYIRRLCFSDLVHTVIIWSMCMTNIKRIKVIYHVPGGVGVMVLNATFGLGRDRVVVGFTTTYAISAYHH